jgi:hypothetical protein
MGPIKEPSVRNYEPFESYLPQSLLYHALNVRQIWAIPEVWQSICAYDLVELRSGLLRNMWVFH